LTGKTVRQEETREAINEGVEVEDEVLGTPAGTYDIRNSTVDNDKWSPLWDSGDQSALFMH
jgi:hypothetical protein